MRSGGVVTGVWPCVHRGARWAGLTYTPVDSHRTILGGKVTVKFNDYYGAHCSAAGHRQDVCHEEGHVLGLAHNDSTNSCIFYAIIGSAPRAHAPLRQ